MNDPGATSKLDAFRKKLNELEKAKRDTDRLRQEAIAELLQARKEINRQLQQLGYEGESAEPKSARSSAASVQAEALRELRFSPTERAPIGRRRAPVEDTANRRCPICETEGHDLRAHRGQDVKRPFTPEELAEKGLAG